MATVCVEIPEEVCWGIKLPKEEIPKKMKKIMALELYRRGTLSLGKACGLAEITRWKFFDLNEKEQIPIQYDLEDWERDKKYEEVIRYDRCQRASHANGSIPSYECDH